MKLSINIQVNYMSDKKMARSKVYNLLILSLLIITIIAILLQRFSLNTSILLTPENTENVRFIGDKALGGESSVTLTTEDNKWLLTCNIKKSNYGWPFCELAIHFFEEGNTDVNQGLNLSTYSQVHVKAKYLNSPESSIRFQLRSFNTKYSQITNSDTWKYVGIEYWPQNQKSTTIIPMKSLQVATWWLNQQKIPIQHSAPEFKNVMVLELATGNNMAQRQHLLEVEYIKFTGKLFTNGQVFFSLILVWVTAAIIVLYQNITHSRSKLTHSKLKAQELTQLNKLLNVETQVLKDKAERDPLTGALNRAGIQPVFTKELKKLSLIFIDIDHFKTINDTHGHAIGDEILKEFSKSLNENCRSTDLLARWGGEEFLLVCPNTVLSDAFALAQNLRSIISQKSWVNNIKMTSSFGVAQRGDESASDFIERADKALYDAKARGRNQVVLSKPSIHLNPY